MSMYGTCSLCGEEILEADVHDICDQWSAGTAPGSQ